VKAEIFCTKGKRMATTFLFSITLAGGFGLGFVMTWYILYTRQKQMKKKYEDTSEQLLKKNSVLLAENTVLTDTTNDMEERFKQLATTALSHNTEEFFKTLDTRMDQKEEVLAAKINTLNAHINRLETVNEEAYRSLHDLYADMKKEFHSKAISTHRSADWPDVDLEAIIKWINKARASRKTRASKRKG